MLLPASISPAVITVGAILITCAPSVDVLGVLLNLNKAAWKTL